MQCTQIHTMIAACANEKRLVALIDPANVASLRVVEKLGFRYERDIMLDGYDHPDHLYALVGSDGTDTQNTGR